MSNAVDARRIENNPDLLHVDIIDGRLWLSDDAREEILGLTGRAVDTDSPRLAIEFLRTECRLLQDRDEELGDMEAKRNFFAYCSLKGIEHAIEAKFFGPDHVGAFEPEKLVAAFFSRTLQLSMALN